MTTDFSGNPMPLPRVIPPRSVVTLVRADGDTPAWKGQVGRRFRVGYYNRRDGLDCIWLVNDRGEYEQTTDHATLLRHFVVDRMSGVTDRYGDRSPRLGRIAAATAVAS